MRRTSTRALIAAIPLTMALLLTACGGESDDGNDPDVASANGGATDEGDSGSDGETTEPLGEGELHRKLLEYAQCLRDQGLDVEDPEPGEGIQLQNEGGPNEADAALEACEHLAPPAPSGGDEGEQREDMLDYAQCMRDNGVEKFEDPKPGEGIHAGPETFEDPDFPAAEKKCNEEIMGGQPDTNKGNA